MILVELYFLAVRFQVRECFCSNPWQIPNLYVWILWMIEGRGLNSSLNNANFGSTNIIISKPRKGTGVLICYGLFYRCFFIKLSHRLFSENLGFRNQLKFDEKKNCQQLIHRRCEVILIKTHEAIVYKITVPTQRSMHN